MGTQWARRVGTVGGGCPQHAEPLVLDARERARRVQARRCRDPVAAPSQEATPQRPCWRDKHRQQTGLLAAVVHLHSPHVRQSGKVGKGAGRGKGPMRTERAKWGGVGGEGMKLNVDASPTARRGGPGGKDRGPQPRLCRPTRTAPAAMTPHQIPLPPPLSWSGGGATQAAASPFELVT